MTNETSRAKIMIQSPYKSGNATPNKKKSTIKIAKKSPKFGTEALGKMTLENAIEMDDILTTSQNYNRIREPIAKSPLRTPNKAPLNEDRDSTAIKGSPNTRFHGTNFDKITITNIEVGEDDQESLGRRKVAVYNEDFYKEQDKRLKIGDIFEGFKKKRINWDQVVFNQETVDFLKQNVHTLLKSDE